MAICPFPMDALPVCEGRVLSGILPAPIRYTPGIYPAYIRQETGCAPVPIRLVSGSDPVGIRYGSGWGPGWEVGGLLLSSNASPAHESSVFSHAQTALDILLPGQQKSALMFRPNLSGIVSPLEFMEIDLRRLLNSSKQKRYISNTYT